ncbi:hypothetical protein [Yoonia sp. 2307UL14-13]|uniref:hypothetical protein n=1 Tax=Yoonia sp. 2307UL14-13 TaxID=3126506 RepID=UPI0030986904
MNGTAKTDCTTQPSRHPNGLNTGRFLFALIIFALAFGHLTGTDAVSAVHGNPNLGGPAIYGVAKPNLPGGVY